MRKIIIILLLALNSCRLVFAETPPSLPAGGVASNIRAIIGEASGEGFTGMKAIACAIRNRGTLKGVYGVNAKHVDKQPKWVWDMAKKAWEESETNDITDGATHWGSKIVDKEWIAKMERSGYVKTFEYKNQAFYKRGTSEKKAVR